ncbi:MAG TPA: ABC transporter ATP-binding protein [Gemmatimonadaceae bacterium]|nr:ABC transporter ATP-binding protein [Gemmatimonadaceae bacterium]
MSPSKPSPESRVPSPAPSLVIRDLHKSFGPVRANRGASLEVEPGEIHAVVGENGAGKSTLMRIVAGLYAPDSGTIEIAGRDVTGWSTAEAIQAGVGMVHQHFMLVPTLTITENVVLGREPTRGIAIDMARAQLEVQGVAKQFGFDMDVRRFVRDLSVGEAQRVEILKTLFRGARLLILDEPTAVLSPPEVKELWRILRGLRDGGGTIVLITHKLDEVIDVSDRITVMRHGQTVGRMRTSETTPMEIARAMVGRDVQLAGSGKRETGNESDLQPMTSESADASRFPLPASLSVKGLVVAGARRPRQVDDVSFTVAAGEILGIAGVEGNGQTELIEAIAGLRPVSSGTILLGNNDITNWDVRQRSEAGLAHIPEDRHRRGLVLEYTIGDNLILGDQSQFAKRGVLDRGRIASNAQEKIQRFDIRPPDATLPARALSGGNQQKIIIAREMGADFSVLLAAQPTRGVDVGAIEFIHAQIRAARDAGKAVLLVSAELQEIFALADRVAVMYGGKIVGVMSRADASESNVGYLMTGVDSTGAAVV